MGRSIFGWSLPPGCNTSDLPGNSKAEMDMEAAEEVLFDQLAKMRLVSEKDYTTDDSPTDTFFQKLSDAGLSPAEYKIVGDVGLTAVQEGRNIGWMLSPKQALIMVERVGMAAVEKAREEVKEASEDQRASHQEWLDHLSTQLCGPCCKIVGVEKPEDF